MKKLGIAVIVVLLFAVSAYGVVKYNSYRESVVRSKWPDGNARNDYMQHWLPKVKAWADEGNRSARLDYYKEHGLLQKIDSKEESDLLWPAHFLLTGRSMPDPCGASCSMINVSPLQEFGQACKDVSMGRKIERSLNYYASMAGVKEVDDVSIEDASEGSVLLLCAKMVQLICDYSEYHQFDRINLSGDYDWTKEAFGVSLCGPSPEEEAELLSRWRENPDSAAIFILQDTKKQFALSGKLIETMIEDIDKVHDRGSKEAILFKAGLYLNQHFPTGMPKENLAVIRELIAQSSDIRDVYGIRNSLELAYQNDGSRGHSGNEQERRTRRLQVADAVVLALAGKPDEQCMQLRLWNDNCVLQDGGPMGGSERDGRLDSCIRPKFDQYAKDLSWPSGQREALEKVIDRCQTEWWPEFLKKNK